MSEETQVPVEKETNTLSQLISLAKDVEIDGQKFETIVMLSAPFEMAEVQADKNILQWKLSTELDVVLANQGYEDFAVFSMITPSELTGVEELYRHCQYTPTDDTVVVARVFGMIDDKTQPVCLPHYVLVKDGKIGLIHRDKINADHLL